MAGRRLCSYYPDGFDGKILRRRWANGHSHFYCYGRGDRNSNGNTYTNGNTNRNSNSHGYGNTYTDGNRNSYSGRNRDRDGNRNADDYSPAFADAYTNRNSKHYTQASSFSTAASYYAAAASIGSDSQVGHDLF